MSGVLNHDQRKRSGFLFEAMGAYDPNPATEPYAGDGGCSRCLYAWRTGSELYVSSLSRNADTVYTKYVSCGGNSQPWDTRSTVLGKRRYYYTTNIGNIGVEDVYKPYIEMFHAFLAMSKGQHIKGTICSYDDTLVFTFSYDLQDTGIQKVFFRKIAADGIEVQLDSNSGL